MEEGYSAQIKTRAPNRCLRWVAHAGALLVLLVSDAALVRAQVRAGAAYLKVQPSVRYQGMAGALTAAIDEVQAFYANPAATGFSREWQWSAAYTRWVADIYSLSANIGRQFRMPWSRRFGAAFGLCYQGVRPFDSTKGRQASVSASDVLAVLSVASPLALLSPHVAIGANFKYLRSDLMTHAAGAEMFDVGMMWCSPRIGLKGPFEYGLLSAGIAADHLGAPLTFQGEKTPLPRTLRAGLGLHLGAHEGLQVQVTGDYHWVRDEVGRLCLGAELAWGYRLAVRTGYEFNDRLLSKLSAGMSLRLDDRVPLAGNVLSGRNRALRLDVGGLEANELFDVASRAGVHHYTIGPERFELLQPLPHDTLRSMEAVLRWQAARDPDLFDQVRYLLVVERVTGIAAERSELARLLAVLAKKDIELKNAVEAFGQSFLIMSDSLFAEDSPTYRAGFLPPGDYLWTVFAYDRDQHWRVAAQRMWPFHVVAPDIEVVNISFEPDPWITESDTQGVVTVNLRNNGFWTAEKVTLTVTAAQGGSLSTPDTVWKGALHRLAPHTDQSVAFTWLTARPGLHHFQAEAHLFDGNGRLLAEHDTLNNRSTASFYTIPKGRVAIPDTVPAFFFPLVSQQVPLVTKVFFDFQSAVVPSEYYRPSDWFYAPLDTLAKRVIRRPEVVLRIEGFCDAVNGEPLDLARKRAMAVRQILLDLGVRGEQVPIDSVHWAVSPDKKITQNAGVHQERRNVRIRAFRQGSDIAELEVIAPVSFRCLHEPPVPLPVVFANTVKGVVPARCGVLRLSSDALNDSIPAGYALPPGDSLRWPLTESDTVWVHREVTYTLALTDTLDRHFRTRGKRVYLAPKGSHLPIVVGLAEFNDPQPFPIVPWKNLLHELGMRLRYAPTMYFRFVGHACGITPRSVNNAFSRLRAANLQGDFIKAVAEIEGHEPALCRLVMARLDREGTMGKGADEPFTLVLDEERFAQEYQAIDPAAFAKLRALQELPRASCQPFVFSRESGKLLLEGDNGTPVGRQINRRIQIEFFYK